MRGGAEGQRRSSHHHQSIYIGTNDGERKKKRG
ncbi:hypothetical protein A2U01_0115582, partial [Trifolium medium]|nr:hypothetical protein [Trifolium medium]